MQKLVESEWPECGIVFATDNISRMANELVSHASTNGDFLGAFG